MEPFATTCRIGHAGGARAALGVVLLSLAACSSSADGASPDVASIESAAVPVAVARAASAPVERSIEVTGTLCAAEEVTLSAKVTGRVRRVYADVGDVVSGGTPLAQIDAEEYRRAESIARHTLEGVLARLGTDRVPDETFDVDRTALVARAKAQLDNAGSRLSRLQELAHEGQGFVADQDMLDAKTAVTTAAAELEVERTGARALVAEAGLRDDELELAHIRLGDATIRAPGKRRWAVAAKFVNEGELVGPGAPLFKLVSADRLKLRATADERDTAAVRVGLEARVSVAAWGDRAFEGTVDRVSPIVDPQTRNFGVEVLVSNERGELRPGEFASAELVVRTEAATFVPLDALVSFAGTEKVFVVDGLRARERIVHAGERRGSLVEVSGVRAGDAVVTRGHTALADGTAVDPTLDGAVVERGP